MQFPTHDDAQPVATRFRDFIQDAPFPCVGAKSAPPRGQMKIVVARDITTGLDDACIYPALLAFIVRYCAQPDLFQCFAVLFEGPQTLSEEAFEEALRQRVQSLSDTDPSLGQADDPRVAWDPDDPHFSSSLGGRGFFLVGRHPGVSRGARRFEMPALVFDLHDQFARLRAEGRYERLRAAIVDRDAAWTGTVDPMLAQLGARSAARQFSGRAVPDDWACPFRRGETSGTWDARQVAADLASGAFVTRRMDS